MSDYFDAASRSVEENRRALLAAVAAGGTAGRQAYEQARAEVGQLRSNAIRAALAEAGQRGAPQGVLDQISAQVGQGYDRQLSGMAAAQGSRDAQYAQRGTAGDSYMSQVQAAIPALRAKAQRQKEALEAKAMQEAEERALRLELGRMNLLKSMQGDTLDPIKVEEHEWKAEERAAARANAEIERHRNAIYTRAQAAESPMTFFEFDKAARLGDYQAALAYANRLKPGYLKNQKISRDVLMRRIREFYAKG